VIKGEDRACILNHAVNRRNSPVRGVHSEVLALSVSASVVSEAGPDAFNFRVLPRESPESGAGCASNRGGGREKKI
jgi:hypothetical protein